MIERLSDEAIHNAAMILAPVFAQNGWAWHTSPAPHIPALDEIERRLRRLADDVSGGKTRAVESGRLLAYLAAGEIRLALTLNP